MTIPTTDTRKAVLACISGRVQGVWFRGWTRERATSLGLSGWVRNEPDGTVSALIAGPAEAVDAMVAALWEGPPSARVEAVTVRPAAGQEARAGDHAPEAGFSFRR